AIIGKAIQPKGRGDIACNHTVKAVDKFRAEFRTPFDADNLLDRAVAPVVHPAPESSGRECSTGPADRQGRVIGSSATEPDPASGRIFARPAAEPRPAGNR